ncbi:hypothetical protein NUU61_007034 [Penicillium alfredii]|uniref:Uncharacterized protein n=1 Tax=Penicillium alfredii TaxID=1506179 RepID=A0A9W9F233_9EURO|nr:uncharacterized protein NUU61_007034 [Penicillium alfredii]KAJ5092164.1 hypothetical protein NUU61_007034 [Penicillium alfredii]
MPIKLPKTFARRKSSGNVLDELDTTPQSSFRVFERPGPHRSMTDGAPLTKRMSEGNVVPSMLEDSDNIFAGTERPLPKSRYERSRPMDSLRKRLTRRRDSGGTYESSTSTRLSSSSTLPSSTEVPPDDSLSPHSRLHDIPVPPPLSGALRAAGRTFSFGGRFKTSTPPVPAQRSTPDVSARQRAMTGSTDNTATPPKLPDSNFDLGTGSDDFHKMFDNLGQRDGSAVRDPSPQPANKVIRRDPPYLQTKLTVSQYSSSPPTHVLPEFRSKSPRPAPIRTDRSTAVEPSPYSWDSRHSEEGLLNDEDVVTEKDLSSQSPTVTGFRGVSPSPNQMAAATTSHRALERPRRKSEMGLRRSGVYSGRRESLPFEDEDAKLVRQSLLWSQENAPRWAEGATPAHEASLGDQGNATMTSEPDHMFSDRHSPGLADPVDPLIADQARLAVQFAENIPKSTSPGNKVMTPSQFEHYRQQQELRRSNSDASRSDADSENEEFDEEDEAEKQREAERQRRKQEAHLSVYRQQMMKVTGQQAPAPSLRPVMSGASSSTPNLPNRLSNPGDKSTSGKSSEEDDEEVPLGILAAHGFPNRNRPPTRLANASSNPNLRASAQPYASSASSVAGAENDMGNRNSLPVFARNLPRDPYFGAGLVNPSNRESLALGGGSVYGGSSSPMPPGGLVGVIANEERARAMRRGSPNTQAMYEQMGGMGGVPRPYSMAPQQQPQGMSATEQAQVQLSQQMASMMQMQMQWMQQMMQMQGVQGPPPPMMKGGMPMPPMMGGPPMPGVPMGPPSMAGPPSIAGGQSNMRPVSMPSSATLNVPPSTGSSHLDQRPLSMLDPNISTRRTGSPMPNLSGALSPPNTAGYAPSITPSERSNAGMASRYRPVSVTQGDSAMSPMTKPWEDENYHASMSTSQPHASIPKSSSFATVTFRPASSDSRAVGRQPRSASDDEDDDEAWAEMAKKRDKKKSNWKMKRGTSSFGDLLGAVH